MTIGDALTKQEFIIINLNNKSLNVLIAFRFDIKFYILAMMKQQFSEILQSFNFGSLKIEPNVIVSKIPCRVKLDILRIKVCPEIFRVDASAKRFYV